MIENRKKTAVNLRPYSSPRSILISEEIDGKRPLQEIGRTNRALDHPIRFPVWVDWEVGGTCGYRPHLCGGRPRKKDALSGRL